MLPKKLGLTQSIFSRRKARNSESVNLIFLGDVYRDKGEREKALHNYQVALGIASSFNWQVQLSQIHGSLARLSLDEGAFDDATAHIERAKSYAQEDAYRLGRVMEMQALIWYRQGRLEAATSEGLLALETYEKLGASKDAERCRELLRAIEEAVENQSTSGRSDPSGELLYGLPCS